MRNMKDSGELGNLAAAAVKSCLSLAPHGVALLCATSVVGCLAPTGDKSDGDLGVTQQAALTNNALTNNALTNNALTNNALTDDALSDPNAREVLKYIASCALPATSAIDFTVDGVAYSFPGELGLASSWGQNGGTCNTSCQETVSACVIARLDHLGEHVEISLRGKASGLATSSSERAAFPVAEGAYYGNIFLATSVMYACIAPGRTGLTRVCGPTSVGCAVNVLGPCDQICDKADKAVGFFPNCRDAAKDAYGRFPGGTRGYPSAATVFLAP